MRVSLPRVNRRTFLAASGAALGAAPLHALAGCTEGGRGQVAATSGNGPSADVGYGPVQPVRDETTGLPLLQLPAGFRYLSFGWTGDPLASGLVTPGAHDGMAAFGGTGTRIRLVRNHEVRGGAAYAASPIYDPNGGGGTTTVEFDTAAGKVVEAWASLAGTAVNCAGGPTPWGSWLTCEETVFGPDFVASGASAARLRDANHDYLRPHGYIFEVPADGPASGEPLRAMGRFVHEAVSVDPATGIVYETEDRWLGSGFYRFIPAEPGNLAAGGSMEMLAIGDAPRCGSAPGAGAGRLAAGGVGADR